MISYLPSPKQYLQAFKSSGSMVLLKLSLLNKKSACFLIGGILFAILAILAASQCGDVIRSVATIPNDIAAKQMALNYLASYSRGEMGTLGSITFGMAIYSSLLAPFTGVVSSSIISPKNTSFVQSSLLSRFTDSFLAQMFTSISLFQLVILTTMSSLISLGNPQSWAVLFVWSSWPILVSLSVIASWSYEAIQRVTNLKTPIIIGGIFLSFFIGASVYNPNVLGTFFGVGNVFSNIIRNIQLYSTIERIGAFGSLFLLFIILFTLGSMLSLYALSKDEKKHFGKKEKITILAKRKHSKIYELEMLFQMMTQILRSPDSVRPIIILLLLGIPIIFFFKNEQVVHITFLVTIPLIVACSWGVNFLGVLGGGLSFLRNQPKAFNSLPWIAAINQIVITLALFSILWVPAFVSGVIPSNSILPYTFAAIASTVLVTRSSMSKAINAPYPTHPGTRGETLVPITTMIAYTLRMSLWGCQYGILIIYTEDLKVQASMLFIAILWSLFRMTRLNKKWQDPDVQFKAIQATAQSQ